MAKATRVDSSAHPLTTRHQRQIGRRAKNIWHRMRPIWGVSWRPGGNAGSFLGKLFRPLGTAVMMVQVGCHEQGRERVGLFGITARIDPNNANVLYDNCVLRHDFYYAPFPKARCAILDTRNDSWIQLAFDVDRVRQRQMERNFVLPAIPKLPEIYYGFGSKESAPFEITPALRDKVIFDQEVKVETNTIKGLGQLDCQRADAQRKAFDALATDAQKAALHAAWDASFISPRDPENTTGLWLLPHRLSTAVRSSIRVFEYFGGMVGADVYNPARKLGGRTVKNEALEIAKAAGVDLPQVIADIAQYAEGAPECQAAEDLLRSLVPVFREKQTGIPADATEDGVLLALVNYADDLQVELAVQQMEPKQQIIAMRDAMPKHIAECCTDEDLGQAVLQPDQPLYARGLCQVQALHRGTNMPVAEALRFAPEHLERERVSAVLWHDLPQVHVPRSQRKTPQKKAKQQTSQQVPTNAS